MSFAIMMPTIDRASPLKHLLTLNSVIARPLSKIYSGMEHISRVTAGLPMACGSGRIDKYLNPDPNYANFETNFDLVKYLRFNLVAVEFELCFTCKSSTLAIQPLDLLLLGRSFASL